MKKNIFDYLKQQLPEISQDAFFNEVDALIFCLFSYAPQGTDLRSYTGKRYINPINKTIGQFLEELLSDDNLEILQERFGTKILGEFGMNHRFYKNLSLNDRYKDLYISNSMIDNTNYCQFAAYTIQISSDAYVICFRGTDGTYAGWYENVIMLEESDAPSQKCAFAYLNSELERLPNATFFITGHSKGGNLALYSSILVDLKKKLQIRKVMCLDSPGFTEGFIKEHREDILIMQHKFSSYVIENTVISSFLFGQDILFLKEKFYIVKANLLTSISKQHFANSWIVDGDILARGNISKLSMIFSQKLKEVSEKNNIIESIDIIKGVFEQLQKTENISDKMITDKEFLWILNESINKIRLLDNNSDNI